MNRFYRIAAETKFFTALILLLCAIPGSITVQSAERQVCYSKITHTVSRELIVHMAQLTEQVSIHPVDTVLRSQEGRLLK